MVIDPQSSATYYTTGAYNWLNPVDSLYYYGFLVSKTTDAGVTWHRDTLQASTNYVIGQAVAVHPTNSNLVYAAGYNGIFYKSTNAGSTWNLLNSGLTTVYYIYDIAPNPQNPNIIYLATYYGVYKTIDGGTNWLASGLTSNTVNDILVHPRGPDTVYAATSAGFYKSTNAGGAWVQQNGGLLDPYVTTLSINMGGRDSSFLFCGTKGGGLHRQYLSIIPVCEQKSETAALGLTCTPNPCRDRVCLNYLLPQASRVLIEVYDAQGRRIVTVADGDQAAGTHQAEWDCRRQAVGVYFVRVFTAQTCDVRKLILAR